MIHSRSQILSEAVSKHYDELDPLYRRVWGEHVHHGWFSPTQRDKEKATERLSHEVAKLAGVSKDSFVCDIGCGYGATSELLATEYGAKVLGLTISASQFKVARARSSTKNLSFCLMDWLENDLKNESFDHLISIESSEHMPDKQKFFSEARRVLKQNGSFVICAWLSAEAPSNWETVHLLEPICREGKLPSMGTESEYRGFFAENGFELQSFIDISAAVKRTWTISIFNLVRHFANSPDDLKYLFSRWNSNAEFLKTLVRIRLAYETGAMRYGVFKALKVG